MAGPWEKFQQTEQPAGPWSKFQQPQEPVGAVADTVGGFAGGSWKGIADMVGIPVDVLTAGMNAIGANIQKPVGGSESLKGLFSSLGLMYEPETKVGQFASSVGESVTPALIPAGAMLKPAQAAVQAGKLGQATTSTATNVGRELLSQYQNPAYGVTQDVIANSLAGLGKASAQAVAPDSQAAEVAGTIGVPMLGALGMGLGKGAVGVARHVLPSETAVRQRAGDTLFELAGRQYPGNDEAQRSVARQAIDSITNTQAKAEAVPNFNPMLGEATLNPYFLDEQGKMYASNRGGTMGVQQRNKDAIREATEANKPAGNVVTTQREVAQSLDEQRSALTDTAKAAQERARAMAQSGKTPEMIGGEVRDAIVNNADAAKGAASSRINSAAAQYENIDVSSVRNKARELGIPVDELESGRDFSTVAGKMASKDTGPVETGILDASGNPVTREVPDTADGKYLQRLSSKISDELNAIAPRGKGSLAPQDRDRFNRIMSLKDEVNGIIETQAPALGEARTAYGTEYKDIYDKRGTFPKEARDNNFGTYRLSDERVARGFMADGQKLDQAIKASGGPDALYGNVVASMKNDMSGGATVEQLQRKMPHVFERFPQLSGELSPIDAARGQANEAVGAVKQFGRETKGLRNFASASEEKAVNQALAGNNPVKGIELVAARTKTDEGKLGLRAALYDHIVGKGDRPLKLSQAMKEEKNIRLMKAAGYDDNHIKKLKQIAEVADVYEAGVTKTKIPARSNTAADMPKLTRAKWFLKTLLLFNGAGSAKFDAAAQTVSPTLSRLNRLGVKGEQLAKDAFLDVDLAKTLLMDATERNAKMIDSGIARYLSKVKAVGYGVGDATRSGDFGDVANQ